MEEIFNQFKKKGEEIIKNLKNRIAGIRTGKASPALVENLLVETYGGQTKLKLMELATITTEGPLNLLISPFDPSTIEDINRALLQSPLSLTPQVEGKIIRIKLPPLSQEQREKLIKLLKEEVEKARENVRQIRDEIRKKVKKFFDEKSISENVKFRLEKEIDDYSQKLNEEIAQIRQKKEKEILGE